jgi:hypothetical protein
MLQPRRGDAVHNDFDMTIRAAAHGELAAEVIAHGDTRKRLDGAHGVIRESSAQVLQIAGGEAHCGSAARILPFRQ